MLRKIKIIMANNKGVRIINNSKLAIKRVRELVRIKLDYAGIVRRKLMIIIL